MLACGASATYAAAIPDDPINSAFDAHFGFSAGSVLAIPEWERVTALLRNQEAELSKCLDDRSRCGNPQLGALGDWVSGLRGGVDGRTVDAVNRFVNSVPYVSDTRLHGVNDYWQTPVEFFRQGGDCEDYAIAKYILLRRFGFEDRDLSIMVGLDRRTGVVHAVLAVFVDGGVVLLDNLHTKLVTPRQLSSFAVKYGLSYSTRRIFLHR